MEQVCTDVAIVQQGELKLQGKVRELLARSTGFLIKAAPAERALAFLRAYPELHAQPGEDGTIAITADIADVPTLVRSLVSADIEVYDVRARRITLEQLFLDLTGQPGSSTQVQQAEVMA